MPFLIMPDGTRDLLRWIKDRDYRQRNVLARRVLYGGKKGRAAARKLRRMGPPGLWDESERLIAGLWGPWEARPPYGFAQETNEK